MRTFSWFPFPLSSLFPLQGYPTQLGHETGVSDGWILGPFYFLLYILSFGDCNCTHSFITPKPTCLTDLYLRLPLFSVSWVQRPTSHFAGRAQIQLRSTCLQACCAPPTCLVFPPAIVLPKSHHRSFGFLARDLRGPFGPFTFSEPVESVSHFLRPHGHLSQTPHLLQVTQGTVIFPGESGSCLLMPLCNSVAPTQSPQ